jgi:hypothetical protein
MFCVFALLIVLVSCSIEGDSPDNPDITNSRVATPSLQMNPDREFNNGPILITLSTTTPDAAIYYTFDGSVPSVTNGARYTEPFYLTADNTNDASYRGYVALRAIGIKENHTNSAIARQEFQIFPREAIGNSSTNIETTGTGYGHGNGLINVTLTLTGGYITDVTFDNVGQTPEFWTVATRYAREFFTVMNSWDFVPAVSGASYSGGGIRDAAKEAIDEILNE